MHFETVYQTEPRRIYGFFRYRLVDDPLAEDLTADTFERAWQNRERYREAFASFSTWLFVIARRRSFLGNSVPPSRSRKRHRKVKG